MLLSPTHVQERNHEIGENPNFKPTGKPAPENLSKKKFQKSNCASEDGSHDRNGHVWTYCILFPWLSHLTTFLSSPCKPPLDKPPREALTEQQPAHQVPRPHVGSGQVTQTDPGFRPTGAALPIIPTPRRHITGGGGGSCTKHQSSSPPSLFDLEEALKDPRKRVGQERGFRGRHPAVWVQYKFAWPGWGGSWFGFWKMWINGPYFSTDFKKQKYVRWKGPLVHFPLRK